jgi:galactose oxidase-like protein/concanavalin A-like lectin/glucanase superfamily protein/Kelch motif protein
VKNRGAGRLLCRPLRRAGGDRGRRRFVPLCLVLLGLVAFLFGGPASAQTEPGLVAAWGFDEGSGGIAGDSSGNRNAGTVVGAAWTTQGRFGSALVFNGTSSRVTGPSVSLGPAFTLMAWVLNPTRTAYETMITVGGSRDFYLGTGVPTFWTGSDNLAFGNAIADGVWHHVAVVSDGATVRAYVDGDPAGTPSTVALGAASGSLQVGAWILGTDSTDYFAGTIDEVRVYSRALTQGEIQTVMTVPVAGSSGPTAIGQWGPVLSWPIAPVHMLLQRTGQVLIFNEVNGGQSARLWNPATGTFTQVPTASNLFCAGHTLLADGRSVVIGGQLNPCCYTGIVDTNLFDATTRAWTRVADMNFPRWYPTATTLPDGQILAISGWIVPGQMADTPEVYDPAVNVWTQLAGATRSNPMYSFMFVLPDGTVLNAGPDQQTRRLDVAASSWIDVGDSFISGHSAVMYRPGLVMKSGTHGDPDNMPPSVDGRTVVIDMTQPAPAWRAVAPMAFPRAYHNLTILPDGSVVATGGGTTGAGDNTGAAVREAELWNPATETWRTMARMVRPRLYHSGALLLPDGRVLMAGGNLGNYFEPNAELYSPPYLFRGTRPAISAAPATVAYGARFFVATPDTASITGVSLVRSGAPTHGFDQNQRFVSLPFTAAPNGLDVTAPADARVAPPGDYMLFILNGNGVPSVARFVLLAP